MKCRKALVMGAIALLSLPGVSLAASPSAPSQPAAMRVLIKPGDASEQAHCADYSAWLSAVEPARRKNVPTLQAALSTDSTADLGSTRSVHHEVILGPAHVVGSPVRYGYKPAF